METERQTIVSALGMDPRQTIIPCTTVRVIRGKECPYPTPTTGQRWMSSWRRVVKLMDLWELGREVAVPGTTPVADLWVRGIASTLQKYIVLLYTFY